MLKASGVIEDFIITLGLDPADTDIDEVEEHIVLMYIYTRLKPLLGIAGIGVNRIDNMCNFIADNYYDQEYSIDLMCNAVYNYINATKNCPSDRLLSDDIETLLQEYGAVEDV